MMGCPLQLFWAETYTEFLLLCGKEFKVFLSFLSICPFESGFFYSYRNNMLDAESFERYFDIKTASKQIWAMLLSMQAQRSHEEKIRP
jgi:hypothetical protein